MSGSLHLCFTTAGLDEMTRREQRDPVKVLKRLHELGRFSVFEVTANDTIAKVMEYLVADGLITVTRKGYPWYEVRLTPRGLEYAGLKPASLEQLLVILARSEHRNPGCLASSERAIPPTIVEPHQRAWFMVNIDLADRGRS